MPFEQIKGNNLWRESQDWLDIYVFA